MEKENKKETFKEVFSDMKELFTSIFADEVKPVKFADYKAEDGSVIRTDTPELQVNSKLTVITPDGELPVPPEVTDLVLMVNDVPTQVSVANGVVMEIQSQEAPEDQANPAPGAPQDMSAEMANTIAELAQRIEVLESANKTAMETAETTAKTIAEQAQTIAKQNELNKNLFSLISKLADSPAVEPISESKQKFKHNNTDFLEEFRKSTFGV